MNHNDEKDREKKTTENNPSLKPDPETLHTTDPQEHMEGPVSSSMKNIGGAFDTNESKEEAERKRNSHL